jgi:UDP-N-acetylmuramoylalanine--D-glutamate ligase
VNGRRIAVYGLGRSGLAIAKAALQQGAKPTVFDKAKREEMAKPEMVDEAEALGIKLNLGWEGRFDPNEVDLLVTNPAVDMRSPVLRQAVEDGIEVVSEVEFAYRISKAPIVAITGTNGKSTTTVMTYLCLKACGEDAILCGNIFGSGYDEIPMTEAALNSTPDQVLVAEISSFQLEWVSEFKPVAAGITNIWPDHLDRYDSFEQYAATKHRIFAAQGEGDFAVVKAHDPQVWLERAFGARPSALGHPSSAPSAQRPTPLSFGAGGEHANIDEQGITILGKRVKADELPFQGAHNYANACMAALLAYGVLKAKNAASIQEAEAQERKRLEEKQTVYTRRPIPEDLMALPDCIIEGLKQFKGIAHRMELVGERGGVKVINNSMCTNPDAVIKSATAVRGPNHLLIGGRNKDLDFKPVRSYLASGQHKAYLYGEARDILKEQVGDFPTFPTMEEAFEAATKAAKSGEIIMLAPGCASTDQFRDFRERGNVFREIAKEWLTS